MSRSDYVHWVSLPVRWGDMDALGHVNNAMYFRYAESGRIAYFTTVGADSGLDGSGEGPMMAADRASGSSDHFFENFSHHGDESWKIFFIEPRRVGAVAGNSADKPGRHRAILIEAMRRSRRAKRWASRPSARPTASCAGNGKTFKARTSPSPSQIGQNLGPRKR